MTDSALLYCVAVGWLQPALRQTEQRDTTVQCKTNTTVLCSACVRAPFLTAAVEGGRKKPVKAGASCALGAGLAKSSNVSLFYKISERDYAAWLLVLGCETLFALLPSRLSLVTQLFTLPPLPTWFFLFGLNTMLFFR